MHQHMERGSPTRPRLRKRCILELEVASSSSDGPRRTQVIAVPEDRLRAAMVEEVDESEVSTVVLEPPQARQVPSGFEDLEFDDFQEQYRLWAEGSMGADAVVARFGHPVLEMMQAQWAACQEVDEERVGPMEMQAAEQHGQRGHLNPSLCRRLGEDRDRDGLQQRDGITPEGDEDDVIEELEGELGQGSGSTQNEGSGATPTESGQADGHGAPSQMDTVRVSQYVGPVNEKPDVSAVRREDSEG